MVDEIRFMCFWCQNDNWVDLKDVQNKLGPGADPCLCWNCNRVHFPNAILPNPNNPGEDYLQCIAYTGPMADKPTGAITVGEVTKYITADGRLLTRGEFIAEYHNDPAEHIRGRLIIHNLFHAGRRRRH